MEDQDRELLVVARIREALGDPEGKLMQEELVERAKKYRDAILFAEYALDTGARIWAGMEYQYNPMHPTTYLKVRDRLRAALGEE
jgi:hypothetical protein